VGIERSMGSDGALPHEYVGVSAKPIGHLLAKAGRGRTRGRAPTIFGMAANEPDRKTAQPRRPRSPISLIRGRHRDVTLHFGLSRMRPDATAPSPCLHVGSHAVGGRGGKFLVDQQIQRDTLLLGLDRQCAVHLR
jgi:hypothetical protein